MTWIQILSWIYQRSPANLPQPAPTRSDLLTKRGETHVDHRRQVPSVQTEGGRQPGEGQGVPGRHQRGVPGQVEGGVLLAQGLHLRLSDRDCRLREEEPRLSRS